MSAPPVEVTASGLWQRLSSRPELQASISSIRDCAEVVARATERLLPGFTDHSVTHMDALWRVLDVVLRYEEFQLVGAGEAFVLGASFYVHDLGMALACTTDGARTLRGTESFKRQVEKLSRLGVVAPERIDQLALEAAARETHADAAMLIAQSELPGLKRYLIEDSQLRERWGQLIGEVSASHGSSLRQLETSLGIRGRIPDAIGGTIDPGYLACVLRITDYAHINHERAGTLRRLVRGAIREESLKHWLAQASVSGPSREDTQLVYASLGPISEVDAWWQFYELARGLDVEIADVGEYLAGRAGSNGRFSLTGVKSATTPQAFARLVRPADFDPVDVRFRSDSMDRLVDLLGGRSLYGEDRFVPIRELIQNARDAVHLFAATLPDAERGYYSPRVDVGVEQTSETGVLAVTDNGIGMSRLTTTQNSPGGCPDYSRRSEGSGSGFSRCSCSDPMSQ